MKSALPRTALLLLLCMAPAAATAQQRDLVIDPGHTFPVFEVRHLGVATQRGRFDRTSGRISMDAAAGSGSAEIRIDARSLSTGNPDLDKLLRGANFLAVVDFPDIVYRARRMAFEGGRLVSVEGDLSFLGVTRPVPLQVTHFACTSFLGYRCGADLAARFRRSDFGMTTMLGLVSDEVTMLIQAEAVSP